MAANEQLKEIARKLIWWEDPSVSLGKPSRFLAQVMTFGTWREVQVVKDALGWDAFRDALKNAPPGVFDARSWKYWHSFFGLQTPEMPRRSLT